MWALTLCFVAQTLAHEDKEGLPYVEHSLQHPYSTNGFDIPHWDFSGSTAFSDQYIRLTPDRQSKKGVIWNNRPWNPSAEGNYAPFELDVRFQVHGQGKKLFGDGFAMWLTKQIMPVGGVFGSSDGFVGMGILFDTYSNMNQAHQQYISIVIGDGKQQYDHDKDGGDIKLAGCPIKFRSKVQDFRVVYDGDLLRGYIAVPDEPWEECFIVRKVRIPKGYHFGLSAATGDLADNHDIIHFKVFDPSPMTQEEEEDINGRIQKDIEENVEAQEHHDPQYEGGTGDQEVGTELPLWVTISMISGVIVIAIVVFVVAMRQQENSHKHFA